MKRKIKHKCFWHTNTIANISCITCGKFICFECTTILGKSSFCPNCAGVMIESALETALKRGITREEKRKHQRLYSVIPIEVIDNNNKISNAVIINISKSGIGIVTHQRLKEQTSVKLRFSLPGGRKTLTIQGGILRIEPLGPRHFYTGILLMNLGNMQKDIDNYVRTKGSRRYLKIDDKISFI